MPAERGMDRLKACNIPFGHEHEHRAKHRTLESALKDIDTSNTTPGPDSARGIGRSTSSAASVPVREYHYYPQTQRERERREGERALSNAQRVSDRIRKRYSRPLNVRPGTTSSSEHLASFIRENDRLAKTDTPPVRLPTLPQEYIQLDRRFLPFCICLARERESGTHAVRLSQCSEAVLRSCGMEFSKDDLCTVLALVPDTVSVTVQEQIGLSGADYELRWLKGTTSPAVAAVRRDFRVALGRHTREREKGGEGEKGISTVESSYPLQTRLAVPCSRLQLPSLNGTAPPTHQHTVSIALGSLPKATLPPLPRVIPCGQMLRDLLGSVDTPQPPVKTVAQCHTGPTFTKPESTHPEAVGVRVYQGPVTVATLSVKGRRLARERDQQRPWFIEPERAPFRRGGDGEGERRHKVGKSERGRERERGKGAARGMYSPGAVELSSHTLKVCRRERESIVSGVIQRQAGSNNPHIVVPAVVLEAFRVLSVRVSASDAVPLALIAKAIQTAMEPSMSLDKASSARYLRLCIDHSGHFAQIVHVAGKEYVRKSRYGPSYSEARTALCHWLKRYTQRDWK
ncbi:hypothetical protein KIPB_007509 [Kipferlia bialata]|uniref:Uncharacterized protein n=1 Tax=Kipferlia bialata TaxID=797122 RepID=A0A9K3D1A7_9EUKA|nr:hypothetical protein KIPB_007509 [Kipferlia bialata]|eukprot:g7509.t1